jgi:PIN domain nuclease of toxin-antitoxin system
VRVLLDTHVFLWANAEPERLGGQRELIEDGTVGLIVSAASSWEIAIEYGLGRLMLPEEPRRYMPERLRRLGAAPLAVEHGHALAVAELPPLHGDPFDRLLVAQGKLLDVPIVTADPRIAQYEIQTLAP